ncbi:MAG: Na(+)-translocating NADH-quinone reductase subunit C [Gammaproteobacteria bacterium]
MSDQNSIPDQNQSAGFFGQILNLPNDSTKKTIIVALLLCFVCSILVSGAAVLLKPLQVINKKVDIKSNILSVADLKADRQNIDELFEQFEMKVVDLESGEYVDDIDVANYDQNKASNDPQQSINLSGDEDIAGINRRAKYAKVYLLKDGNTTKQIVLPVHGYGLWSTMYGFLALESDANTIKGLKFYQHAETPGLGGEIDNPNWQAKWVGKKLHDNEGSLKIGVARGQAAKGSNHQIDGLSGATLTSQGVSNMIKYWLSDGGFGPYLKKLQPDG